MAKKKETTTVGKSNYSLVKGFAFWGLALTGLAGLLGFIFGLLTKLDIIVGWGNRAASICSLIAQIALLISVWVAAWDYAKHKSKIFKIIYWIVLILSILGVVGVGVNVF